MTGHPAGHRVDGEQHRSVFGEHRGQFGCLVLGLRGSETVPGDDDDLAGVGHLDGGVLGGDPRYWRPRRPRPDRRQNHCRRCRSRLVLLFAGQETEWRNRLIWGDKKYVLPSLLPEFAGRVNLIYIDPPFATGADFSFATTIPDSDESFTKEPSMIEQKAYRDTWGRGLDGYMQWFYEMIVVLRELLTEDGSIYVHCDWRVNSHLRLIMDELFGPTMFRNEISWVKNSLGAKGKAKQYPKNQDIILFYTKSDIYTFNKQMKKQEVIIEFANGKEKLPSGYKKDADGRYYWTSPRGDYTDESIKVLRVEGRIEDAPSGAVRIKYFVRREGNRLIKERLVDDVWNDIEMIFRSEDIDLGYPTQKPEALLERILMTSSNEGDLVLDCFCGSGTTAAVAEKLGRVGLLATWGALLFILLERGSYLSMM